VASRPETVERVLAALVAAGDVRHKRMFGEVGLYLGDRFVGMVADDQLFFKITPGSRPMLDASHDAPPYPGASPHLCVPEAHWRDLAWMAALMQAVAADVPPPKPKKK
jgi:TfoX/Sxy family transcriptional regulator of competence genes